MNAAFRLAPTLHSAETAPVRPSAKLSARLVAAALDALDPFDLGHNGCGRNGVHERERCMLDQWQRGELGVFGPGRLDGAEGADEFFRANGFVVLRGIVDPALLSAIEAECEQAQAAVTAGELPERHGSTVFLDASAGAGGTAERFTNYVTHVNELSPSVLLAVELPPLVDLRRRWLGEGAWLLDDMRFGVVYQDARPGRESGYTRIGWHSDWQSGPNLDVWPSVAFTFHLDATSPANGFLRVVPGSHRWATPVPYQNVNGAVVPPGSADSGGHTADPPPFPMPLGFEKVSGEIGVYAERGDVILHDAYLWHSAARATDDDTRRRHVRGSWYSGAGRLTDDHIEDFVKNAAR
jgi:ectoine hydroxylase-related dioxygenase (phytanoyl-CoA dioxygenase family)